MKKLCVAAVLAIATALCALASGPKASPDAVVQDGCARFTVLRPEMIRIEYSPKGVFEDNATFSVVNRQLPVPKYSKADDGEYVTITTDALSLRYRKGSNPLAEPASPANLSVTMSVNGNPVVWYPGLKDSQNLKGTYRTLDGNNGDDYRSRLEDGLISRSGWAVINDSPSFERADGSRSLALVPDSGGIDWAAPRADADALDLYFLGYGHNYKKALYDFTLIAGKIPLPPDYVLGYWYSKYDNYSADDFRNIVKSMRDNDINADVLILDMDWHWNGEQEVSGGRGGWTGWSWNTNLIPDPEGLLADIHKGGLRAALNLHPADGVAAHEDQYKAVAEAMGLDAGSAETIPWMLEDRKFAKAFFDHIIRPLEKQGVDFWWLDWQQHLTNPRLAGLGETMWCNHVFFNDMKKNRPDRRPVIFHRWGGLGSHRYQIGFSGDTYINFPTLAFEPYFTATASNVGYGYWGHDLGGHMINYYEPNDPELLLRWMQFGVFTPIFRTHATKGGHIERRIWTYDNFPMINQTVKLRYALFPYLYTMARKAYDTGVGLCRPMYYEYPETAEAYEREGQYFFGDDILVAPVVEPSVDGVSKKEIWFPEGKWWSVAHGKLIDGGTVRSLDYTLDQIPYFYRQGAVIVKNPPEVKHVTERPDALVLDIVAGADGACEFYEDAGDNADYATKYATTSISHKQRGRKAEYTIAPRKGAYEGMPLSRSYKMRIFNTPRPVKAKEGGRSLQPSYDASSRCTIVDVPSSPCDKGVKVTVEYAD
ncbi:oligosaccharide 4-alpha-D-glucosyltransferase [Muribaculaceae bacterium]|jgi:hypothetical protein|nr:oligosaccharide 4-alpha-D-glucosyltransferase [Muribaculaceae bacterium]